MPHLVEEVAVDAINTALVSHDAELVWDFRETLSHRFALPDVLTPARSIDLSAAWGELRVTEEALVLALSVHTAIDAVQALVPVRRRAQGGNGLVHLRWPPSGLLVVAGVVALAISLTGLVAGRALGNRRPRMLFPLKLRRAW
jgi:hypothetical protein